MMNRKKIQEGYDLIHPTDEQKDRMLENILSTASARQPAGKDVPMKKYSGRKPVLVAAIVAVMLLLVGCAAVVAMNLNDLIIGEEPYVQNVRYNEDGSKIPATQKVKHIISDVGLDGSKNQQAMQEWLEFKESYDPDGSIRNAAGDFQKPEAYIDYSIYTQEMLDKIDAICEKYGLKPTGNAEIIQQYDAGLFSEILGIDSIFKETAQVEAEFGGARFNECGNFNVTYYVTLKDKEAQQEFSFRMGYTYHNKDYFSERYFIVEDSEAVQQWNYTLPDGTEVLIVSEKGDDTHILYDREDAFISVYFNNVGANWDSPGDVMSRRDMELIAQTLDYTLEPKQVKDVDQVIARLEESRQEYENQDRTEFEAQNRQQYEENERHDSYADLVACMRDNEEYFTSKKSVAYENFWETMEFVLMDVTGDGEEELLLGKNGCVHGIWTIRDGVTVQLESGYPEGYLCEGKVFENYSFLDGQPFHFYRQLTSDGYSTKILDVEYHAYEGTWVLDESSDGSVEEAISEERAMEIIGSFVRVELDMKPIREFPMN